MIDLAMIKTHCRVESDFTEDDALLIQYRDSALENVRVLTGRKWYEKASDIPPGDTDGLVYTPAIAQAVLLTIGTWYANRESDVTGAISELPSGFWRLIQPYRLIGV